ncbi:cleavage and polyadenylation specific factor 5 [Apiospora phragmitis]|uniref:Cleavage and polyadenylation specific factor 5 n=1 Tax=Apiospora phragmitis TaxID=2905665 RepID=A0ABR1W6L6_9PEZI
MVSRLAVPHLLSKYNFEIVYEDGGVVATTPGSAAEGYKPHTESLAGDDDIRDNGKACNAAFSFEEMSQLLFMMQEHLIEMYPEEGVKIVSVLVGMKFRIDSTK